MDPYFLTQKFLKERLRRTTASIAPPPAYTPNAEDALAMEDPDAAFDESLEDTEPTSQPTTSITVDARTTVTGSNNIISVPSIDHARLSATLLALIRGDAGQILQAARNGQQAAEVAPAAAGPAKPSQNVTITLLCGVEVKGDRNVVGQNLPISQIRQVRPQAPAAGVDGAKADVPASPVQGVKRKADDEMITEPEAKRERVE